MPSLNGMNMLNITSRRASLLVTLALSTLVSCAPKDFRPQVAQKVVIKQGGAATLQVSVERDEGLKGPVTVSLRNLPEGVTGSTITLAEAQTSGQIALKATASAPLRQAASAAPAAEGAATAVDGQPAVVFSADGKTHELPLAFAVQALSGSSDKTFGSGGVMQMKLGVYLKRDHANALAATADEKILVGGQKDERFAVYRLNRNGTVDKGFGKEGLAVGTGAKGTVYKLLVLPDGGVIAVGSDQYESAGLVLAKFTKDGKLDTTFGKGGVVNYAVNGLEYHGLSDAAVQSDGKVVAVGRAGTELGGSGSIQNGKSLVVRFNPDGSVDRTFGSGGRIVGGIQEYGSANDVELGDGDTLLVAGTAYNQYGDWETRNPNIFYLARYLSDGSPDTSFGNNGFVTYSAREEDTDVYGTGVSLLPDGKMLTIANVTRTDMDTFDTMGQIRVAQYLPDGARDTEFGEEGAVTYDFGYSAFGSNLAATKDGFVLTASVQPEKAAEDAPSLVKLSKAGLVDESFNFDGRVGIGTLDSPLNPVVLNSGQIVAGTLLSPYFQDYDENDDAAKVNVELVRINP